jgi:hypothetical protein
MYWKESVLGMPLQSTASPQEATTQSAPFRFVHRAPFQSLMLAFCILFGLAMIADIQTAGDGWWFWYGTIFNSGKRLYADLSLALQPAYILETAWFLTLFGKGWLVGKIPAVIHLVAYCIGIFLVVRESKLSDAGKALVLGSAFFLSLCSTAYRFDDYHVVAEGIEYYSLFLLIRFYKSPSARHNWFLAAGFGILSGITITTRVNDGSALFVGIAIVILCLPVPKKFPLLLLLGITTALTVLFIVRLTRDTFHDYVAISILRASEAKGGIANVLLRPIQLLGHTAEYLRRRSITYYLFGVAVVWTFLLRPFIENRQRRDLRKFVLGIILLLLPLPRLYLHFFDTQFILGTTAVGVYVLYALGIFVCLRFLHWKFVSHQSYQWNPLEILLIIPLGQLASMSMSTAGYHFGVYSPHAMLIVLLPLSSPFLFKSDSVKSVLLAYVAVLCFCCAVYKYQQPYVWHSFQSQPLFSGRQWYRHPVYGPMIIETGLLQYIEPACKVIDSDPAPRSLLGIPVPFANYFCDIPPWHDDVQTYYDTSTRAAVDRIMSDLQDTPPTWIMYQKEWKSLIAHERTLNNGQPIPHRFLAQMIEDKVKKGEWRAAHTSAFGNNAE